MIRKSTLAVVLLFGIALAALLILKQVPNSPLSPTPTILATSSPNLVTGWKTSDVSQLTYKATAGKEQNFTRNSDGSWTDGKLTIEGGKLEQILSELLAARVVAQMPADISLKDIQLDNPVQIVILHSADGRSAAINFGGSTPTQSGYYVRVDNGAAVILSKDTLDTVLQLLDEAGLPTPTPLPTPTTAQ